MTARRPLSGADVDALFAGKFTVEIAQRCDNCMLEITGDDALTFGDKDAFITSVQDVYGGTKDLADTYEWAYEMPITVGSDLEREIVILRRRHDREVITLCYACVDALQAPISGRPQKMIVMNARRSTPTDDEPPRLFAV